MVEDQARADDGDAEVTSEDLEGLQKAHPHDPKKSKDSSESLNKSSDPSLNDRDAPVGKGVGNY